MGRDFREQIEGYQEIKNELEICRKYGVDYSSYKGKTAEIIERLHPKKLSLKVSKIIEESRQAKTLRLVSGNSYLPPFQAGQYINLFVDIDGIRTSRPYSISSSPRQTAYYDITVQRIADGFVSNYLLDQVKVGDELESTGPAGHFYYNPLFHGKRLVFLAGGSGITPFMSMIRETTDAGLDREIHLIYGKRTTKDIIFHEELKELSLMHDNFNYSLVISEPEAGYKGFSGLIDSKMIRKVLNGASADTYYICGPGQMYDFCWTELEDMGIPRRKIRKEMFSAVSDISREAGWPEEISPEQEFSVNIAGKDIKAKAGEPLLIALEKAGIEVPVCCRSGECSACRVKLLSGKVFHPRGVLLRQSDIKYGYIHSCKAYPLEDLKIQL